MRTLLTILGVATAIQLYLTMDSLMNWVDQDLQKQLSAFAGKVFVQQSVEAGVTGTDFPAYSSSLESDTVTAILSLNGVDRTSSSPVLFVPLTRVTSTNTPPSALAVGIKPGHEAAFLGSLEAEAGTTTLNDAYSVILGQNTARRYQTDGSGEPVKPGQTVEIQGRSFTVVGVLKSSSSLLNGAVLMPLATAQDLFNRSDTVSAVIITAAHVEDLMTIKTALEAQFPDLQAMSQDDIAENANVLMDGQRKGLALINHTVIGVAVIIVTIVVVVAVMEQRREIGTLRAIGARRWRIFSLVAGESLALSLLGALIALPFSVVVLQVYNIIIGGTGDVGSLLSPVLLQVWASVLGIAVVIGVLAALLPAWQAVRVDPLEALRYE